MVLIFFSRCHVFYPLFHLSGLPFSFFCKQSHFFSFINIFYSFSPFFIPHRHFTPFSCLSLPLPPVFILFAHVYTTFSPFQSFFAFSQLIFIFFCFFRLFHRFIPLRRTLERIFHRNCHQRAFQSRLSAYASAAPLPGSYAGI